LTVARKVGTSFARFFSDVLLLIRHFLIFSTSTCHVLSHQIHERKRMRMHAIALLVFIFVLKCMNTSSFIHSSLILKSLPTSKKCYHTASRPITMSSVEDSSIIPATTSQSFVDKLRTSLKIVYKFSRPHTIKVSIGIVTKLIRNYKRNL
jgi:hypothetical protein